MSMSVQANTGWKRCPGSTFLMINFALVVMVMLVNSKLQSGNFCVVNVSCFNITFRVEIFSWSRIIIEVFRR